MHITKHVMTSYFNEVYKEKWGTGATALSHFIVIDALTNDDRYARWYALSHSWHYLEMGKEISNRLLDTPPKEYAKLRAKNKESYMDKIERIRKAERAMESERDRMQKEINRREKAEAFRKKWKKIEEEKAAAFRAKWDRLTKIDEDYKHWVSLGYMDIPFRAFKDLTDEQREKLLKELDAQKRKDDKQRELVERRLKELMKLNPNKLYTMVRRWVKAHERTYRSGATCWIRKHESTKIVLVR